MESINNIMGDLFLLIGINLIWLVICGTAAYMVVYNLIIKLTSSKDFANFIGGIAMLTALYFSFMNIFLPAIQAAS